MSAIKIAPYFHPTQIVLVDDDIDFLGNLSLQLDADLAYLLFDSTQKAQAYLNERQFGPTRRNRFFREAAAENRGQGYGMPLEIDPDGLDREMRSPDRFTQISVALVDYAMPQMDGLEFCRGIADPHIKKILFTGVATESVAVDAFNQGIIDRYIRKHEYSVYDTLNSAIREFQKDYLSDVFAVAADLFQLQIPNLLSDPCVSQLMERLRRSHGVVEYYLAADPPGFWLVSASGIVQRLVIQSDAEAKTHSEHSHGVGLSEPEISQMARNELIPFPLNSTLDVDQNAVQPAHSMPGGNDFRWAVFDMPEGHPLNHLKPSYNEFLEWLDTVGYSLM